MFECSTRNLIDWACWCSDMTIKQAFEFSILSKADKEDYKIIMDEVNKYFRDGELWGKNLPVTKEDEQFVEDNTYDVTAQY